MYIKSKIFKSIKRRIWKNKIFKSIKRPISKAKYLKALRDLYQKQNI